MSHPLPQTNLKGFLAPLQNSIPSLPAPVNDNEDDGDDDDDDDDDDYGNDDHADNGNNDNGEDDGDDDDDDDERGDGGDDDDGDGETTTQTTATTTTATTTDERTNNKFATQRAEALRAPSADRYPRQLVNRGCPIPKSNLAKTTGTRSPSGTTSAAWPAA